MSVLVGRNAPDFDVAAVVNGSQFVDSIKLSFFKGKYVVLFFYPLDFTLSVRQSCMPFRRSFRSSVTGMLS